MASSNEKVTPKRRPGRPATGKDPLVTVRLPKMMIEALDRAAAVTGSSRSELIRGAVERDLSLKAKEKKR